MIILALGRVGALRVSASGWIIVFACVAKDTPTRTTKEIGYGGDGFSYLRPGSSKHVKQGFLPRTGSLGAGCLFGGFFAVGDSLNAYATTVVGYRLENAVSD